MIKIKKNQIGIYKYSSCNTSSILNALNMIEADYILSEKNSPDINQLDKIILPGVGNMKKY